MNDTGSNHPYSICRHNLSRTRLIPVVAKTRQAEPSGDQHSLICRDIRPRFRGEYVQSLLEAKSCKLSEMGAPEGESSAKSTPDYSTRP